MIYTLGVMLLRLSTYIIGFCLMDCGPIASGLAYSGDKDGVAQFDRIKSVKVKGLIIVNKVKNFLACWNISVHEWLKYYVFMRMLDNKKRGGAALASLVTFMVSGIWHGFYPGFLFFFFGAFLMDYHNKVCSPVVAPYMKWCPDVVQDLGIMVFYYINCSYFAIAFWLLNFEDFHRVYCNMYYCGHILIIGTLLPCLML